MFKRIEKQILDFVDTLPGIKMREVTHGTLYVTLEEDRDCDSIHRKIRNHYRKNINDEGGVNMYSVGGEFAFDFVPEDREAPVFSDTDLDLTDEQESELDVLMNLEAEAVRGK